MGRTNKSDLREDENVAEVVKQYTCLYKGEQGYREKDRVANAWKAIDEELGYEEGWFYNNIIIIIIITIIINNIYT